MNQEMQKYSNHSSTVSQVLWMLAADTKKQE